MGQRKRTGATLHGRPFHTDRDLQVAVYARLQHIGANEMLHAETGQQLAAALCAARALTSRAPSE